MTGDEMSVPEWTADELALWTGKVRGGQGR